MWRSIWLLTINSDIRRVPQPVYARRRKSLSLTLESRGLAVRADLIRGRFDERRRYKYLYSYILQN